MLQIITTVFNTVIHSLSTIISFITKIPSYIDNLYDFVILMPQYIAYPLIICVSVSVIIAIKRLVI